MCVEHLGGTLEINDQNPSVTHFLSVLIRTFVSLSEKLTNLHFHRILPRIIWSVTSDSYPVIIVLVSLVCRLCSVNVQLVGAFCPFLTKIGVNIPEL